MLRLVERCSNSGQTRARQRRPLCGVSQVRVYLSARERCNQSDRHRGMCLMMVIGALAEAGHAGVMGRFDLVMMLLTIVVRHAHGCGSIREDTRHLSWPGSRLTLGSARA